MADNKSTRAGRTPAFWGLVAAFAVIIAVVVSLMFHRVVGNEPTAQANRDRSSQERPASAPTEADQSTGSVSPEPARSSGPVESPGTTTKGVTGSGDSAR